MDLRNFLVQEKPCKTCPFEGTNPVALSPERYAELIKNLMGKGQHFCHSAGNSKSVICRGGRNIQLKWLCAVGALSEPTDEAFNKAVNEAVSETIP